MNATSTPAASTSNTALRGMVLFVDQAGWPIAIDATSVERVLVYDEVSSDLTLASEPVDTIVGTTIVDGHVVLYSDLGDILDRPNPDGPRSAVVVRVRAGKRMVGIVLATGSILNVARPESSSRTSMPLGLTPGYDGLFKAAYTPNVLVGAGAGIKYPALQLDLSKLWSQKTLQTAYRMLRDS